MPHAAASHIISLMVSTCRTTANFAPLTASEAQQVLPQLRTDSAHLLYSALVTFIDAMRGIQQQSFSWSIVKLYYSAFYSVRTILAANGIAVFYVGTKPFSLHTNTGAVPRKENGATHKVVWGILEREFPQHRLFNQIDGQKSNAWLTRWRELINYQNVKFTEPLVPPCFAFAQEHGITRSLQLYSTDEELLYTFDPDHAVIAFPLECLKSARRALVRGSVELDADDESFLNSCCVNATSVSLATVMNTVLQS